MTDIERMLAALRDEVEKIDLPPRSLIVGLVMRGQITREQAEKWARDNGELPFEEHPDPADFDPMAVTEWTISMTIAWIHSRTLEAVRDAWGDYLSKCWVWKSYKEIEAWEKVPDDGRRKFVGGYELKQKSAPHPSGASAPDAKRKLMTTLQKGDLRAYSGRDPNPIPDREWEELSPFTLILPYRQIHHDAVFDDNGALQFKRVRVRSADVMHLWPDPNAAPIEAEADAEKGAKDALIRQDAINAFAGSLDGRWPQQDLYDHLKKTMTDFKPPVRWGEAVIASKHLKTPLGVGDHGPRTKGMKSDKSDI